MVLLLFTLAKVRTHLFLRYGVDTPIELLRPLTLFGLEPLIPDAYLALGRCVDKAAITWALLLQWVADGLVFTAAIGGVFIETFQLRNCASSGALFDGDS